MHRWLPSLDALRAFEAADRHVSFSRAADELHVASVAVWKHVLAPDMPVARRRAKR